MNKNVISKCKSSTSVRLMVWVQVYILYGVLICI